MYIDRKPMNKAIPNGSQSMIMPGIPSVKEKCQDRFEDCIPFKIVGSTKGVRKIVKNEIYLVFS